ncbi:hypothetical protein [Lysinibacillus sp. NPDC047702]
MKRGYSPVGLSVNAGNFVQINVNNIDKRTKRKSETWMIFFKDTEGNTHALMCEVQI